MPDTSHKVTPCLWFENRAEEAVAFYVSLVPGSRIDRIVHAPLDTPCGPAGSVLTVEFTLAGSCYLALNGGGPGFNHAVSFHIHCDTQEEVDRLGRQSPPTAVRRWRADGSVTAGAFRGRSCRAG